MKNWEPLVSGPALAMLSTPAPCAAALARSRRQTSPRIWRSRLGQSPSVPALDHERRDDAVEYHVVVVAPGRECAEVLARLRRVHRVEFDGYRALEKRGVG